MRRILSALLISYLIFTPCAWADGQALQKARQLSYAQGPKAFQSLRALGINKELLGKSLRSLGRIPEGGISAEFGQVLIFTMTMAGIDLVAHQIQTVYNNKIPSPAALLQLSSASAEKILGQWSQNIGNSDFVSGLSSGFAVQSATKLPTSVLMALIANPASHSQLVGLLSRSILSTSILVGWNFGSQLTTEARYLIDDPSDYARSASFAGVSVGALSSILDTSADNLRDRRIAGLMFANILQVVFVQQELREQWFNNTWRTKVMTGEFATMLGSMIAAGTVGTALFPGAGTVTGAMFGVAGALVYIAIPQSYKNRVTYELQNLREQALSASLTENALALGASFQTKIVKLPPMMSAAQYDTIKSIGQFRLPGTRIPEEQRTAKLQRAIGDRHKLRNNEITLLLERAHLHLQEYFTGMVLYGDAERALNKDFDGLNDLYASDLVLLRKDLPTGESNRNLITLVENEVVRVRTLSEFFAELRAPLLESIASIHGPGVATQLSDDAQTVEQFVSISYARGFKEEKVLNPN